MAVRGYDFAGWATRNDLKCSDGRTIRRDAFKECDGKTVPLVYQHQHNFPENVLGHAVLENKPQGVRAYGFFNDTDEGRRCKKLVEHGDITALSIYANKLKQNGGDVLHGVIRELSLVLSPANPGAYIDFPSLAHGEDGYAEECFITTCTGEPVLAHSDNYDYEGDTMDYEEIYDTLDDDQRELFEAVVNQAADIAADETAEAYEDIIDDYEDAIDDYEDAIDEYEDALDEYEEDEYYDDEDEEDEYYDDEDEYYDEDDDVEHGDYYGETFMKHNTFEDYGNGYDVDNFLAHAAEDEEFRAFEEDVCHDMKRYGSFQDSWLAHAEEYGYGVENLDYLFPEYHNLDDTPQFIKRKTEWVAKVLEGVSHTPFARIKNLFANITGEKARALGYIKGNRKKEEVFTLLKRTTTPTTIYKKQRLDRDDKLDLRTFKIIAWLQGEMKLMLEEESARSILFSDGRPTDSEDHVNEQCIRPIYSDDDLFTIKKDVAAQQGEVFAETFMNTVLRARTEYRGSGKPSLFITEDMLTDMLLIKDSTGRKIYKSVDELATAMRVGEIVPLPMEVVPTNFLGLEVNLTDYTVGTDTGGEVTWFDDFDLNINQMIYLAETRFCGALTKPFSAIAFRRPA